MLRRDKSTAEKVSRWWRLLGVCAAMAPCAAETPAASACKRGASVRASDASELAPNSARQLVTASASGIRRTCAMASRRGVGAWRVGGHPTIWVASLAIFVFDGSRGCDRNLGDYGCGGTDSLGDGMCTTRTAHCVPRHPDAPLCSGAEDRGSTGHSVAHSVERRYGRGSVVLSEEVQSRQRDDRWYAAGTG